MIPIEEIKRILQVPIGSEDDIREKIVIQFFKLLEYNDSLYRLDYPIKCYKPGRRGRKPEADIVFFGSEEHNEKTSLLVVETKRDEEENAEIQAKFYSDNLFVPFFIKWEKNSFTIYQVMRFSGVNNLGTFSLDRLTQSEFNKIKAILSPQAIKIFCDENEIKKFTLDRESILEILSRYKKNLIKDLNIYNFLQMKEINLSEIYIPLFFKEFEAITCEEPIDLNFHEHSLSREELLFKKTLNDLVQEKNHILIIGAPGSGKTTELKKLCITECQKENLILPVFIPIRIMVSEDLNLVEFIKNSLKSVLDLSKIDYFLDYFISTGNIFICIDGLDELDIRETEKARKTLRKIDSEIRDIIRINNQNRIFSSVRKESLRVIGSEIKTSFKIYDIQNLTKYQIKDFISRWFSEEQDLIVKLMYKIRRSYIFELLKNPLILTLVCINFNKTLNIPNRLSRLYQQAIDLFIEKWDATRRISRYSVIELTPEKTIDLLMEIALHFHLVGQASFNIRTLVKFIESKLDLINIEPGKGREIFDEINLQYGLLCSWSIENVYAFPHLSFQEYFTARALREKENGFEIIKKNIHNPTWMSIIQFYAELGDASQLLSTILDEKDNIFHNNLFLAANILSRDPKITETEIRSEIIKKLGHIAKYGPYYNRKAIDLLSNMQSHIALNLLKELMEFEGKTFSVSTYAFKYAWKILPIEDLLKIIKENFLSDYQFSYDCLDNLDIIPKEKSIQFLKDLLLKGIEKLNRFKRYYHKIWRAAEKLVQIGQESVFSFLISYIKNPIVKDRAHNISLFIIRSLEKLDKPTFLEKFLDDEEISNNERVYIAGGCSPKNKVAKDFLLKIVADKQEDHYTRRDAASELGKFLLSDNDIPYLIKLMIDFNPQVFWGGPALAAQAIYKIRTVKALETLKNAKKQWEEKIEDILLKENREIICLLLKGYILLSKPNFKFIDFYSFLILECSDHTGIWDHKDFENLSIKNLTDSDIYFVISKFNPKKLPENIIKILIDIITNHSYELTLRSRLLDKILNNQNWYIYKFYHTMEYLWNNLELDSPLKSNISNIYENITVLYELNAQINSLIYLTKNFEIKKSLIENLQSARDLFIQGKLTEFTNCIKKINNDFNSFIEKIEIIDDIIIKSAYRILKRFYKKILSLPQ